jgi:hypothetical protein
MNLQPIAQRALLAAFRSPGHALRRARGGFATPLADIKTSGSTDVQVFTRRAVNWLDNAGLVDFDDPQHPSVVRLNARGERYAEQLLAQSKAVRA